VRIAVIGAGIAGIGSAWLLSPQNTVDVYEAEERLGGHAYTVDLTVQGTTFPADSGFQVFNTRRSRSRSAPNTSSGRVLT
jgi:predicted NAD/FAD-binding protein